jgi:hypothetical protein
MNRTEIICIIVVGFVLWFGSAIINHAYGAEPVDTTAIEDVQHVIVITDDILDTAYTTYKRMLKEIIPHPDAKVYIKEREVGLVWEF